MEIREILYVKAVADYENLTKAAKYLNITQPSLSQSIKGIEDRLNNKLFNRSKRGMSLTEFGSRFLNDAMPLIMEYNMFLSKIENYKGINDTHHIGLYKLSFTSPINAIIMNFISLHSEDNYIIKVDSIVELEQMLIDNKIDIAIGKYSPIQPRRSELSYNTIFREKLYVFMSKDNPLANKKVLSIKDLVGNKLIASDPNEYPSQMTSYILEKAGIELDIHTSTNYINLAMIFSLVKEGFGISFGTELICSYYKSDDIKVIELEEDYYYEICIVEKMASKKNTEIIDFIKANM